MTQAMPNIRHDRDAEEALAGAVCVAPTVIMDEVESILPLSISSAILDPGLRTVYEAAMNMHALGIDRDLITVEEQMRERGTHKGTDTKDLLIGLVSCMTAVSHAPYHARIIRKNWLLRRLMNVAYKVAVTAGTPDADEIELANTLVADGGAVLSDVCAAREGVATTTAPMSDLVTNYISECMADRETSDIKTGFPKVDKAVTMLPGDVVILAARPGVGKTALAVEWAMNIARSGINVGILSLEMGWRSIASRVIQRVTGVSASKLRYRNLDACDHEAIANRQVPDNLFVDSQPGLRVSQARAKASLMRRRERIEVLFIDYLQLVRSDGRHENRAAAITEVSAEIKDIARQLEIPIIALAQFNRESAKSGRAPELYDLRDSGSIEQDASVVVAMHWRSEAEDETVDRDYRDVDLILLKNREGQLGEIGYCFDPKQMTWWERPPH